MEIIMVIIVIIMVIMVIINVIMVIIIVTIVGGMPRIKRDNMTTWLMDQIWKLKNWWRGGAGMEVMESIDDLSVSRNKIIINSTKK